MERESAGASGIGRSRFRDRDASYGTSNIAAPIKEVAGINRSSRNHLREFDLVGDINEALRST
jgi:hypothetical protein